MVAGPAQRAVDELRAPRRWAFDSGEGRMPDPDEFDRMLSDAVPLADKENAEALITEGGQAELVAAVANEGTLSLITALTQPPPADLANEIAKTCDLTYKPHDPAVHQSATV